MAFKLNRRAFLRNVTAGVATGLSLPVLECMVTSKGNLHYVAHAANARMPVRYLGFMINNGVPKEIWTPIAGANGALTFNVGLNPVKHLAADINQITNLDAFNALREPGSGLIEHENGQWGFWTGYRMESTKPNRARGPSIEWILGKALGGTTFPCITTSLPRGFSDRTDESGRLSWEAVTPAKNGQPGVYKPGEYIYSPAVLANKLFGKLGPVDTSSSRRTTSILDQYAADAKMLQKKLSAQDRVRLDEHLTTVQQIEQQLVTVGNACQPLGGNFANFGYGGAPIAGDDAARKNLVLATMPVMKQLVTFAFQCDLTRYVLFEMANAVPEDVSAPDAMMNDHFWSHAYGAPGSEINYRYFKEKMTYLASFLDAMKASKENDRDILYNSIVLLGSDISEGTSHSMYDYPIIQAGQAGGKLKTGQILSGKQANGTGTTFNNLHATLLTAAGLPTDRFGEDGTGRFPGLLV